MVFDPQDATNTPLFPNLFEAGVNIRETATLKDNANSTHRYQVSAAAQYPIGRLTMQYGGDLRRESGLFEGRRLILRYTRAF